MNTDKPTLKIQFDTQEQLEHFATWLSNKAADDYNEHRLAGDNDLLKFHHPQDLQYAHNDKRRYANANFINDNTIFVTG